MPTLSYIITNYHAIELRSANFHQPSIDLLELYQYYLKHPTEHLRLGILAEVEYYNIQHPIDVRS